MKWKNLPDILKFVWVAAVLIFAVSYIYRNWTEFVGISQSIPMLNIGMAFCCILIPKMLLALNFQQAVRMSGQPIDFSSSNRVYQVSQMGKYIPGSIWQFVGKAAMLKEMGIPGKRIAVSILLETGFVVGASALFGFWVLIRILLDYLSPAHVFLLLIGIILLAVGVCIYFSQTIKQLCSLLIRNQTQLLAVLANQFAIWSLFGLSIVFLQGASFAAIDPMDWLMLTGIFSFSYFVSFLVPFAPAGIGIREALIILGFQLCGLEGNAAFIALSHRLLYFAAEVLLVFLLFILKPSESCSHESP